ncbi:MAG TPA: glycosyltransferase family 1 protein [Actinomycetota bacterium]|nr:glycosyltransferase family 1 protein [Actinomycetota bacterium]
MVQVIRVALDGGPLLDPPTGVARYTAELHDALETIGCDVSLFAVARGGDVRAQHRSVKRWRIPARIAQTLWMRTGHPTVGRLTRPADVVHATNFVLPPTGAVPGVVTIHDLSFFRDDAFPGAERLRTLVPWSVERARAVIVPTKAVGDEVADRLGVDAERIFVTHEGVSPIFFGATPLSDSALAEMGITAPFVLTVGTIEPRKNLARLLKAWGRSGLSDDGWTLVIAGPAGWGPDLAPTPGVVLPGWVADETLPGLLAAAEIFCYPSLYEGFGLPPLEAMAAGTAVVAGRYSAAEEVLGEAAALVEPSDTEGLAATLIGVAGEPDRRSSLARRGRARALGFTWTETATRTLAAYEAVIQGGSAPLTGHKPWA